MSTVMKVANVTLQHDFCEADTANRIRDIIRGPGDVLFYCSPCTGGSQLQHANRAMYSDGGNSHYDKLQLEHLRTHEA
eukprot:8805288-Lingulodinium_polyedra.AAC.1